MSLPLWAVEKSKRKGFLKVTCPRKDCRRSFWVHRSWLKGHPAATCSWCFKAARKPE